MDYTTPHQYLRELKELLLNEKAKINEQKNLVAKLQEFETATIYREIEKKLTSFLDDLEFKTPKHMHQLNFDNLKWQPWIGPNYHAAEKKLLIIGESHYDSVNREGDLEYAECIQWFIHGVEVGDPNNPQPFIRNIERAFYGDNPTPDQKQTFWNSIAYHVLIQRTLASRDERPVNDDFVNGWNNFFKIVHQLKPDYCLFCGVEAAAYNGAFIEAANNHNFKAVNITHGKKVGNVALRFTTIADENGHESKLLFIKHPSSYFKREEWGEIIEEEMPDYVVTL